MLEPVPRVIVLPTRSNTGIPFETASRMSSFISKSSALSVTICSKRRLLIVVMSGRFKCAWSCPVTAQACPYVSL